MSTQTYRWEALYAFFILPIINIFAIHYADVLHENLSYIANALNHRLPVLLWASATALYLLWMSYQCIKKTAYTNRIGIAVLLLSCMGMIVSVLIPYAPDEAPLIAKLHIDLSMWATMSFVLFFFHFMLHLHFREPFIYQRFMPIYTIIVSLCLLYFLLLGSVTSLLEAGFSISMGILLYTLKQTLYK